MFFVLKIKKKLIFIIKRKWQEILTGQHVDVGSVRDGEDVGWDFISPLASVQPGAAEGVHGKPLVGVDSDAEKAGVCLQGSKERVWKREVNNTS